MGHIAKIIDSKVLSDGTIAVLARCCEDPLTDSWHTESDLESIESACNDHCARVASLHEKRLAAEAIVRKKIAAGG